MMETTTVPGRESRPDALLHDGSRTAGPLERLRLALALIGPALVIFCSSSVELLRRNPEYFGGDFGSAVPFFAAAVVYLALGAAAYALSSRSRALAALAYAYLASGPLWIVYSALLLLNGDLALLCLLAGSAAVGWHAARNADVRAPLLTGVAVFAFVMLAITGVNAVKFFTRTAGIREVDASRFLETGAVPGSPAARLPDIYQVMFDALQTDVFENVLDEPARSRLKGLTWYPNASTLFGHTTMSVGSFFAGAPYDYKVTPTQYIYDGFHSQQSLVTQLKALGYRTFGFIHEVMPRHTESPFDQTYRHEDMQKIGSQDESRDLFASLWFYGRLPRVVSRQLISEDRFSQLEAKSLLPTKEAYTSLQGLRRFMEWEGRNQQKGGRYFFFHLLLPHRPWVLDRDCEFQGATGVEEQAACAVRTMGDFLDFLERQGRLEDSLVIMHADHGSGHVVENGKLVLAEDDPKRVPEAMWGRARPTILIKPVGVGRTTELAIDPRPADLLDLFPTIFAAIGQTPKVPLIGSSLLAETARPREHFFHWYVMDGKTVVQGAVDRYKVIDGKVVFDTSIDVPH